MAKYETRENARKRTRWRLLLFVAIVELVEQHSAVTVRVTNMYRQFN
jgi:hypothetical protein